MSKRDVLRAAFAELAKNKPSTKVNVPSVGDVYLREVTLGEVEAAQKSKADDPYRIARGIARILVDEDGERLYNPDSDEDVAELALTPFASVETILEAANKANGVDASETAEKN